MTVMCSSLILPLSSPFIISLVCVSLSVVPSLQLSIFIFLGSFILSVQNNKLSIMFIPVTIVSLSNFKTSLVVSTNTNSSVLSLLCSIIKSLVLPAKK